MSRKMDDDAPSQRRQPPLEGFQRKYLRGLVHGMQPIVQIGQQGITDAVMTAIARALADHELIKVRMHEPEDKKAMAAELAQRAGAELCGLIGHQVILFRRNSKNPKIELPRRKAGGKADGSST